MSTNPYKSFLYFRDAAGTNRIFAAPSDNVHSVQASTTAANQVIVRFNRSLYNDGVFGTGQPAVVTLSTEAGKSVEAITNIVKTIQKSDGVRVISDDVVNEHLEHITGVVSIVIS